MAENTQSSTARLTRQAVLRAALALLNDVGIDALSTRRLAERLGVQSPTLYWHFRSKAELLAAMAETIMLERHRDSAPKPGQPWQAWLLDNARSFRAALLAYRDGARLHAGSQPRGAHFDVIEGKMRFLCDAGLSPDRAFILMFSLGRFIVGWVLEEQAVARSDAPTARGDAGPDPVAYPLLARGWATLSDEHPDRLFERSVRLFIAGAEAALRDRVDWPSDISDRR
jgi:TetR/AcrR family tetracycline transcriptional repressor